MKRLLFLILAAAPAPVLAGGAATGGATEITQILNNVQLVMSYAKQVSQYQNQLQQYQTMLKNLENNPAGYLSPDLAAIANNMGKVSSASRDIGSTMSKVDQNFANMFKSPQAGDFAEKFKNWTTNSLGTLQAALLNAGLQRQNFASDSAALQALLANNQAADGNLGAIKTLGTINAAQIQETMKLRDLISQQQIAQGTYMASQTAKEQAKLTQQQDFSAPYTPQTPIPAIGTMNIVNWNSVLLKK